jgi:hypothetical protein
MNKFQRYIILLAISLLPVCSFGQFAENSFYGFYNNDDWIDPGKNTMLSLSSTYFASPYSAPAYLNNFILLHYNEDNLRNEISKKLKSENYFGIEMVNNLRIWPVFDFKLGGTNYGLGITLGNTYEQKIYFTDDFFKLMYEGNVPFAGKTAQIAPLDYRALSYQEAGLNLVSRATGQFNFGIGLSYIKGNNFYELNASKGTLFTSDDGDSIHADINLSYKSSDPSRKEAKSFNGSGSGFSAFGNYNLNSKSSFYIALDELGFIFWNNKSVYFNMDTSGSFTGFDIFDKTDPNKEPGIFIDTFFKITESTANASYLMWLKPRVNLVYSLNTSTMGSKLIIGATYRFDHYSFPGMYLQYRFKPVKNLYFQGGISYDEYKNAGGNLELGFRLYKKLVCSIGSYHVEQFFTSMTGQSLYFGITGVFRE